MKQEEMEIVSWREKKKGESLQGFFSVALPSGLRLIDMTYHKRKDGARWVGMPAKSYQKDDGSTSWVPLVEFTGKAAKERFSKQALQALDNYFAQQPAMTKPTANEESPSF
jgi:hypothetical protein